MDDAAESRDVDKPVKGLPVLASKAANPAGCGSDRKGDQEKKTGESDGDKGAFGDVFEHSSEAKSLIGTDIREEMQANVEEGKEAEHAAETNEIREVKELAQGGNGEGDQQETKGPITGKMLQKLDGIGAKLTVVSASGEKSEGRSAGEEHHRFRPFCGKDLADGGGHGQ